MTDTLSEIRERIGRGYKGDGEANWPAQCFNDVMDLLAHIDALTAAARWLVDNSTPQHAASCAGQADDAGCICGVSEQYVAVLAIAEEPHDA